MLPGRAGLTELIGALAARTPSPGGGAAAAVAAALGCASAAMAANYSTGPKYPKSPAHMVLAATLTAAGFELLAAAESDAEAFATLEALKKTATPEVHASACLTAALIPANVLRQCAQHAETVAAFLPACNPRLASDVAVAVHLLAGAGRAAWATLRENRPNDEIRAAAADYLRRLDASEAALASGWPSGPGRPA